MINKDPVLRNRDDPSVRHRSGLRARPATVALTVVAAAVVMYLVWHFITAIISSLITVAIVVGILYVAFRLLTRHRRSS
jgi:Flp pilus assembly protein TadB